MGPDHVHVFVAGWKNHSIAYLAQRFKGATSRVLRRDFWPRVRPLLWGDKFWSGGYFAETVGRITTKKMKHYIDRMQARHRTTSNYHAYLETHPNDNAQTSIIEYAKNAPTFRSG